jgi:hypothetical protein
MKRSIPVGTKAIVDAHHEAVDVLPDVDRERRPMTVRAEGDEIVILVRLTLRPRDNVMDINFDITTGGDRTTMSRFDKDSTPEVSRYVGHLYDPRGEYRINEAAFKAWLEGLSESENVEDRRNEPALSPEEQARLDLR